LWGLQHIASKNNIPLELLCLCFVAQNPFIDKVLLGVDSLEQLRSNLRFSGYMKKARELDGQLRKFIVDDEKIILPSLWREPVGRGA
jgi:predicted aldo/keto reductase-like oxidoreductase